jgi:hypothetical protein
MSIIRDLFIRFNKKVETSDDHKDSSLSTHYYKATFNQTFQSVEELFRQDADCRIVTVSKDHGEIAVEIDKPISCFLIVTIVSVRGLETAVDFNISSEKFSPIGLYPILRKRLISYYEKINKLHTLVRIGKSS